ncbi:MAG: DUF4834 family protein [Prevotella sp.]|jgi:ABC-type lipoprotein release transport system permease subunit|nr:DUF4834 family protein [Prevotella sp.]MBO7129667.1 DUF4834 family protein [Prevotella sp.]
MLKGFIAILLFILIGIAVVVAVVLRFMYKGVRNMRDMQEQFMNSNGKRYSRQEYIRNQREQREKNPFDKDYFKSSGSKKNQQQQQQQQAEKQTTTRRTTTDSGVTIIDDRETEEKKKIFDNNDGEYVEFEEV